MSRKHKSLRDLRSIEPDSQAYWEEILHREGLSMKAGTTSKLSYAGSASDLEFIEGANLTDSGRTSPKKPAE